MGYGEGAPFQGVQFNSPKHHIGYFAVSPQTTNERVLFGAAQDLVASISRHRLNMDSGFQLFEKKKVQVGALKIALTQSAQDTGLKTADVVFKSVLQQASPEDLSLLGDWAFRNYQYLQSNVYPEKGMFYNMALYGKKIRERDSYMRTYATKALGGDYAQNFMAAFKAKAKAAAADVMPFLHRVFSEPQKDAYQVIMNAIDEQFSQRGLQKKFWGLFWR